MDATPPDVFEALSTTRAIRRFRPDPVPRELLERVVWAATRAANPRNTQGWDFVVLTDRSVLSRIADLLAPRSAEIRAMAARFDDPAKVRMYEGAAQLFDAMGTVPATIIIAGHQTIPDGIFPGKDLVWGTCMAAAQNLMVAARALGLGTTLTTLHLHVEPELRDMLAIPDDQTIVATIPIGFTDVPFTPVKRRPVDEVLHWEQW